VSVHAACTLNDIFLRNLVTPAQTDRLSRKTLPSASCCCHADIAAKSPARLFHARRWRQPSRYSDVADVSEMFSLPLFQLQSGRCAQVGGGADSRSTHGVWEHLHTGCRPRSFPHFSFAWGKPRYKVLALSVFSIWKHF